MSAEQEEIIVDRVVDEDESEDQLLAEEKVEKTAADERADVEEIPTQGRYFTSQKQLDATQLYLNEIGFSSGISFSGERSWCYFFSSSGHLWLAGYLVTVVVLVYRGLSVSAGGS